MDKQMKSLHKNERWELLNLLIGRKVVGNMLVYKVNNNNDGLLECYKDLLVGKGYV